jgi:hypothetical protein
MKQSLDRANDCYAMYLKQDKRSEEDSFFFAIINPTNWISNNNWPDILSDGQIQEISSSLEAL